MTTDERLGRSRNRSRISPGTCRNSARKLSAILEIVDTRLTFMAGSFASLSLDSRMVSLTKAILDFGEIANRMQLEQSRLARLVEPAA